MENRIRRRKEIQQESRRFEDEGLRARKTEGRESETGKRKFTAIGRNQPLNQDKTPLSAAVGVERTQRNDHCR